MTELIQNCTTFGLFLTLGAYLLGLAINKRFKSPLTNPLLLSLIIIIPVLLLCGIDYDTYYEGAKYISYLLTPATVRLSPAAAGILLENTALLEELGFEIEEFGENTLLLRQIPMDLSPEQAAETAENMAADLLRGRRERKETVRDEILHTVACKAAIKAGWKNDEVELLALVKQVMADKDLKYCPHGRPICITLSKKQLEKQFKRT